MGLAIAFGDTEAFRARCSTSTRVEAVGRAGYEQGAFVPGRWRPLGAAGAEALRATPGTPDPLLVELVAAPAGLTPAQLPNRAGPVTLDYPGKLQAEYKGWRRSQGGELTVTANGDGRLLGVHLDNWDRHPYSERLRSRRRLGLNLGPGPRYIIIGMVDALEICRALSTDYARVCPHTGHVRTYAATVGLPVLRIRLEEREGYVMNTELWPDRAGSRARRG